MSADSSMGDIAACLGWLALVNNSQLYTSQYRNNPTNINNKMGFIHSFFSEKNNGYSGPRLLSSSSIWQMPDVIGN
jgi:hypothetical protein